jgi:hypothetical protein
MDAAAAEQVQATETAPQAPEWMAVEPPAPATAAQPAQETPAEPVRRLAPVREDGGRRLAPPREAPAQAREEAAPQEASEDPQPKAAPSPRALRTFAEKWKAAKTPEERQKALRFALDKGVITPVDLEALQGKEPAPPRAAPVAAPAAPPGQAPVPAGGTTPAAQPGQSTAPGVAPAAPPEVPKIHGQPVPAVKAAAEKLVAVARRLEAKGAELGWAPAKGEPMRLFEDFEGGAYAFEATGDVTKRLVELGAVELAALQGGGGPQSTLGRRLELGMLALTVGGPAATRLASHAGGMLVGKVSAVARALASQVRRWRR